MFARIFNSEGNAPATERPAVGSAPADVDEDAVLVHAQPETERTPEAAAASSSQQTTTVALTTTAEYEAVAASSASSILAMASLRAAAMQEHAGAERTPTEIVAVVDVSGSMQGDKMKLMKEALHFVVGKGLQAQDSLAIVAFASSVDVELPFTRMDAAGKQRASRAVDNLCTRGATNLSGGLLQGLDLVCQRVAAAGEASAHGTTRSVILFTDGLANNGITDTPGIVAATNQILSQTGAPGMGCAIFTFGFGQGHNEDMLRAISDASNGGQYYFLTTPESIPVAFADALGGLVSVVAQNVELTAHLLPTGIAQGTKISKVLGSAYKYELAPDGSRVTIRVGDMYAEDEKDLLVELSLPALGVGSESTGSQAHVRWQVRCFSVSAKAFETEEAVLDLARPAVAPAKQAANPVIEEQRSRILVADVMERAAAAADSGNLKRGQELLEEVQSRIMAAPEQTPTMQGLVQDLVSLGEEYSSRERYEGAGRKMTWMSMKAHTVQRSAMAAGGAYEKKSKRAMKSLV